MLPPEWPQTAETMSVGITLTPIFTMNHTKDDLIQQMRFLINDLTNELNRLEKENPTYQRIHDVESFFSRRSATYQHQLKNRNERTKH